MSLLESITELKSLVESYETECKSLVNGRKASAPRCRKHLQSIKLLSHNLRKQITTYTQALPIKSRSKKETLEIKIEPPEPEEVKSEPEEDVKSETEPLIETPPKRKRIVKKKVSK